MGVVVLVLVLQVIMRMMQREWQLLGVPGGVRHIDVRVIRVIVPKPQAAF